MTFAGDEIKFALPWLGQKFRLSGLDPAQFCECEGPDDFAASAEGRGNAHIPVRRIDGDVYMLDVLAPDGNVQVADGNEFRTATHSRTDRP